MIIIDGYSYHQEKIHRDKIYFVCAQKRKLQCPGRGIQTGNRFRISKNHRRHNPDDQAVNDRIFLAELRTAVLRLSVTHPVRAIYESLEIMHPAAARRHRYGQVERTLRNWRLEAHRQLPIVFSLENFADTIQSENWRHLQEYFNSPFEFRFSYNYQQMVIIDTTLLTEVDNRCTIYYIHDCQSIKFEFPTTAGVVMVSAVAGNQAFLCMAGFYETLPNYRQIIREFSQHVHHPERFYIDMAANDLKDAIREAFPQALVRNSLHTYVEAIFKKLQESELPMENAQVQLLVRKLMVLPLTDSEESDMHFLLIGNSIPRELQGDFAGIYGFIRQTWIDNDGPARMSIYEDVKALTDCQYSVEKTMIRTPSNVSSIWNAIGYIQRSGYSIAQSLRQNQNRHGLQVMPLVRSLVDRTTLQRIWTLNSQGAIDHEILLDRLTSAIKKLFGIQMFINFGIIVADDEGENGNEENGDMLIE